MLDQVLNAFRVLPDHNLSIMKDKQTLFAVTVNILQRIKEILEAVKSDVVLAHGDTCTTFVTVLANFCPQIPVGIWKLVYVLTISIPLGIYWG